MRIFVIYSKGHKMNALIIETKVLIKLFKVLLKLSIW